MRPRLTNSDYAAMANAAEELAAWVRVSGGADTTKP